MKDETGGVAIEGFVVLKPKMYSFLVDENSEHKKVKVWMNKNFATTISHNECKDVLLNKKYLVHLINRNKDYRMRTYKINKILLPCSEDKT